MIKTLSVSFLGFKLDLLFYTYFNRVSSNSFFINKILPFLSLNFNIYPGVILRIEFDYCENKEEDF